jgi:hypothetical protein
MGYALVGCDLNPERGKIFLSSTGSKLVHWMGGWVSPRAGLDAMKKGEVLLLLGIETRPSS